MTGIARQTGALESSLWELESLRQHVCPSIATLCGVFKRHLGDATFKCKIEDYLDLDLTKLFEQVRLALTLRASVVTLSRRLSASA